MNTDLTTVSIQDIEPKNSTEKSLVTVLESTLEQYQHLNQEMAEIIESHRQARHDYSYSNPRTMNDFDIKRLDTLSKTKEREFKQFVTALQTMKQLQAPPLQVNIKAQSAYIAQNQQNNIEINDPQ